MSLAIDNLDLKNIVVVKTQYRTLDKRKRCLGIFLDIAKALDSVSHEKLIIKIKKNSKQKYLINGSNSDYQTVKYGIPR